MKTDSSEETNAIEKLKHNIHVTRSALVFQPNIACFFLGVIAEQNKCWGGMDGVEPHLLHKIMP
jgi:hypothetical protein